MRSWLLALALTALPGLPQETVSPPATRLTGAIARHDLAWQLSEPDEVKAVLGPPLADETGRDGGMELRIWRYAGSVAVFFVRQPGTSAPFVLAGARDGDRRLGPEPGSRLTLRTTADLSKLRPFTGLQNVDASGLDLRSEGDRLRSLTFDTRTLWPPADRLPPGFDPAAVLRDGKDPGLRVRALNARGIDGRNVTIGVIDQPLVDHVETRGRLITVARIDVDGVPPQMHGSAVVSLAAGASSGVAPRAEVAYIAIPMWKAQTDNTLYIDALDRLLSWNDARRARLRVVSISWGGFDRAARASEWRALVAKAESQGVLVVTCDITGGGLEYGLLAPVPGGNRDQPDAYVKGSYGGGLLVPGDGRTYAHHEGAEDYGYAPKGGLSWGAPYLAGVAALGLQVNPNLTPARIRAYLVRSATQMPYGDVINPEAFVRMCQDDPDRER